MVKNERKPDERRRHHRTKFHEKVTVHHVTESKSGNVFEVQGNPLTTKALDVSEGGIRLELGETKLPTSILKLNFKVNKDKTVDVYSKLAWAGDGACGLQFIVLDEEVRKIIKGLVDKAVGQ